MTLETIELILEHLLYITIVLVVTALILKV
jgi:hypothetical protein